MIAQIANKAFILLVDVKAASVIMLMNIEIVMGDDLFKNCSIGGVSRNQIWSVSNYLLV